MATLLERFEAKYIPEPNSGCWLWAGAWSWQTGYGFIADDAGKQELAHRVAYRLFTGPIPEGLELDHLCRVRCCVNPAHLEAVTRKINIRRGNTGKTAAQRQLAKTHCKAGHPYSEENTIRKPGREGRGRRLCRICDGIYQTRNLEKQRQARLARPPKPPKTQFKCGHPYIEDNIMRRSTSTRNRQGGECKECNRLRAAAHYYANLEQSRAALRERYRLRCVAA
jgi:hypothetical protein